MGRDYGASSLIFYSQCAFRCGPKIRGVQADPDSWLVAKILKKGTDPYHAEIVATPLVQSDSVAPHAVVWDTRSGCASWIAVTLARIRVDC